ncbi:MAG: cyclic lactone autoinducer peptide [Anaerocolumna sp.]
MKKMFSVLAVVVLNVAMISNLSVSKWFFYEPEIPEKLRNK